MLKKRVITECCKRLLLWLFLFSATVTFACDAENFVFEEFGMRCQRIGEYIRDLQIARKMQLPSFHEKRGKLLNEWVSFFLDHGREPPAGFSDVIDRNWSRTIFHAGETISKLAYEKIEPDLADPACIIFELIAQPQKLEATMHIVASWSDEINSPPGETIDETAKWITKNMNFLILLNRSFEQKYRGELQNSFEFIAYFNRQWGFMLKAPSEVSETAFKLTRQDLTERMKAEFERWRIMTFM